MVQEQGTITILLGSVNAILLYAIAYFLKRHAEQQDKILNKIDNHENRITIVETKFEKHENNKAKISTATL